MEFGAGVLGGGQRTQLYASGCPNEDVTDKAADTRILRTLCRIPMRPSFWLSLSEIGRAEVRVGLPWTALLLRYRQKLMFEPRAGLQQDRSDSGEGALKKQYKGVGILAQRRPHPG